MKPITFFFCALILIVASCTKSKEMTPQQKLLGVWHLTRLEEKETYSDGRIKTYDTTYNRDIYVLNLKENNRVTLSSFDEIIDSANYTFDPITNILKIMPENDSDNKYGEVRSLTDKSFILYSYDTYNDDKYEAFDHFER